MWTGIFMQLESITYHNFIIAPRLKQKTMNPILLYSYEEIYIYYVKTTKDESESWEIVP